MKIIIFGILVLCEVYIMYECIVFIGDADICTVRLKSITQVCKFLETCDFTLVNVDVITPKNRKLDTLEILRIWRS